MPRLLTRTSNRGNFLASASAASAVDRSPTNSSILAFGCAATISARAAATDEFDRPLITTFAPSAASAVAIANPMPFVEPVTSADLSLSFRSTGELQRDEHLETIGSRKEIRKRSGFGGTVVDFVKVVDESFGGGDVLSSDAKFDAALTGAGHVLQDVHPASLDDDFDSQPTGSEPTLGQRHRDEIVERNEDLLDAALDRAEDSVLDFEFQAELVAFIVKQAGAFAESAPNVIQRERHGVHGTDSPK